LVNIDQRAVPSSKPVRPRKALIVLVALLGGLVLGTALALLRGAFKDYARQLRVLEINGSAQRIMPEELAGQSPVRLGETHA